MTTKAQYLSALASRCEWVDAPVEDANVRTNTGGALALYNVRCMVRLPNGAVTTKVQGVYVRNEGTGSESALPAGADAGNASPFNDELRAYIATRITASRPKIVIDRVDEANEFGIVTAYEVNAVTDTVEPKRYFVAKDTQGRPYIKAYVGA